jgi:diapolycopene oxygenase
MKRAVIIGSGIGGLAAAIKLARTGWSVEVFEKGESPGGKMAQVNGNGFRFDAGPSLFTLPDLVNDLLDADLRIETYRLPVVTRYFWSDGSRLDAFSDPDEFCREAAEKTGVSARSLGRYLSEAADVYNAIAPVFIFSSLHRIKKLFRISNLPALLKLHRLKPFTSLHRFNKKLLCNEKLVQMLDRYATYNGSDPYQAPATLRVIAHLEHNLGAFLPRNGIYSIVEALMKQAVRLNIRFYFSEPVAGVLTNKGRVTGVRTSARAVATEVVVNNSDIYHFYSALMPDARKLKILEKQQRSSSALIFYWGIKAIFPKLEVHNIFFSGNYRDEFNSLFRKFEIHDDPTVYIYISSKINPHDAPEGFENWFVMVNAPEYTGQNLEEMIPVTRRNILKKLEGIIGKGLEDRIVFEEILDPLKIEARTGSWRGSLYGPSSNSPMSAFRRHPNFSSSVKGLYFTGGSVHPGGGIPLCISSANIVAGIIDEDHC